MVECVHLQRSVFFPSSSFGYSRHHCNPSSSTPHHVAHTQKELQVGSTDYRNHNGLTMHPSDLCWQGACLSDSPNSLSELHHHIHTEATLPTAYSPIQGRTTAGTLRWGHSWNIGDWQAPQLLINLKLFHPTFLPSFSHSLGSDLHCDLTALTAPSLCSLTGVSSNKSLVCLIQPGICFSEDPAWTAS